MSKKLKTFYFLVFLLTAISAITGFFLVTVFNRPEFALSESGCIENSQAFILVIAFLTYVSVLISQKNNDEKMITLFLAVLMYAFILREVDFNRMNLPNWAVIILYGKGRNITIVMGFAIAIIGALMNFAHYKKASLDFIKTKRAILLITAGVVLLSADIIEHYTYWGTYTELIEEEVELLAYCIILTSAIFTKKIPTRK